MTPSQRARTRKGKPKKAAGTRYDTRTYNHAVRRACERAGVPLWHPHRLRHSFATRAQEPAGAEAARTSLGHADLGATQIYAERDMKLAADVARAIG